MKRYQGEALPERARIAVIANDALGNFVAATPLLQMLKARCPGCELHYYGGTRTAELQDASDLIDRSLRLHGTPPRESAFDVLARTQTGGYHLVVNLESTVLAKAFVAIACSAGSYAVGPAVGADGRGELAYADDDRGRLAADKGWMAPDVRERYPFLQSGFIGEIFCRLAYLDGPIPGYRVPIEPVEEPIPTVLVATAASLPEKLWPIENWRTILERLKANGISVGLVGAAPSEQRRYWKGEGGEEELVSGGLAEDLRGRWALPQVAGALSQAKVVLTIDNGKLHLATAAGVPVIGLFRHGIHRLWAPPSNTLTVLTAGEDRTVADIEVDKVWEALERAL